MEEKQMKEQLIKHLQGGEAYLSLAKFLDEIPYDKIGKRPEMLPYSFYEVFYHIAYAQKDIIEYCTAEGYKSANWPDDYWPDIQFPESEEDWEELKADYFECRKDFEDFILDPENRLMQPVKNGEDHTLLRELMLVIEHTSYHTGQLLIILRLLGLHKS
ncbi:DinB family protein [Autumnicola psychrophila]|uniref:DinB family protein n=1 Tax=Autumnicola psychrophila TaxID=3075592 RepID=A0ABU3DTN0_9FLAO|nr:DinB family protein [Zunongwangia sp. F225]MDT0687067.1 DinB family protein [Zunongwangia sp. F225]